MVKISALPPMTSADGDDEAPIVDDSAAQTKKFTLTLLKEWLQSLTSWVTASMRSQVVASGIISAATLGTTGNKAVTGVGFTPKLVLFRMIVSSNSSTSALMADGSMTATTQHVTAGAAGASFRRQGSQTHCLAWVNVGSAAFDMSATRVSLDADGFTINVGVATSSAFDWEWIAIA